MPIYFAPMEGVTDAIFRATHHACFSGVDKYFIPFISPTQNMVLTARERAEIIPENNAGVYAVAQILTKHADHFIWAANALADLGYQEVNLNMGCPSGTVTGKGKGSGMLRDLDHLKSFLDEVYAHSPIPVSIKTRIGFHSEAEWPALLELLRQYPVGELIIHPRTRRQFYKGIPFEEAYAPAFAAVPFPIILNGDLFTPENVQTSLLRYPKASGVMLGRGLIGNPALAQELCGGKPICLQTLRHFHDQLCEGYLSTGNAVLALVRMRMVTYYIASLFEDPHKPWKLIRKARSFEEYTAGARMLFEERNLLKTPYYSVLSEDAY